MDGVGFRNECDHYRLLSLGYCFELHSNRMFEPVSGNECHNLLARHLARPQCVAFAEPVKIEADDIGAGQVFSEQTDALQVG